MKERRMRRAARREREIRAETSWLEGAERSPSDGATVPLDPRPNPDARLRALIQSTRGFDRQADATTTRPVYKVSPMRRLEDRAVPTAQPSGAELFFFF